MTHAYTIHLSDITQAYGYESSQGSRHQVLKSLEIPHTYLAQMPQAAGNWKDLYAKWGFAAEEVICLPHTYSDIGHDQPSVTSIDAQADEIIYDGEVIVQSRQGNLVSYYTSGKFLEQDLTTKKLTWYHGSGEIALTADYVSPKREETPIPMVYKGYLYHKDGRYFDSEALTLDWLAKNSKTDDIYFRDDFTYVLPKLRRFMQVRQLPYYEYIHYNIFFPPLEQLLSCLNQKTNYLVASSRLNQQIQEKLPIRSRFLPPVAVTISGQEKDYQGPTDYCLVGHFGSIKQIDWAIMVFSKLYQDGHPATLTIYGGKEEQIKAHRRYYEKILTPNIHFAGHQSPVPYHKHQVYLSCSQTECFANACVEAMAAGLVCLLSNVDMAHREYAQAAPESVRLFDNPHELYQAVQDLATSTISNQTSLQVARQYSFEQLRAAYQQLLLDGHLTPLTMKK